MDKISEKILQLAKDWDAKNPVMLPVDVPDRYVAKYLYKQPVTCTAHGPLQLPDNFAYEAEGKWGIVSVESDHELSKEEMSCYQEIFREAGMGTVGCLRLVKQTFFLDMKAGERGIV